MKISRSTLKSVYGIDLPKGTYSITNNGREYNINTVKDDTLGCVLCGYNTVKGMLTDSRRAYRLFELRYYGMEFDLNIINAFTQPLT